MWGMRGCCELCGRKYSLGYDPDWDCECPEENPIAGVVLPVIPVLVFGGVALVVSISKKRRIQL